jgi:hypothetical protein
VASFAFNGISGRADAEELGWDILRGALGETGFG